MFRVRFAALIVAELCYLFLLPFAVCGADLPDSVTAQLPRYYEKFKAPLDRGEELDYVLVEVNGEVRMVRAGRSLGFVRGDMVKVQRVALKRSTKPVEEVNVVGFRAAKSGGEDDDRGKMIDTAKALHTAEWAMGPAGRKFAVIVASAKTLHGLVYLERLEPALRYVDIKVNEQARVMREGETLRVKGSDLFKVDGVFTNLKKSDDVRFQIVQRAGKPEEVKVAAKADYFDIVFSHRSYVFAKIPLIVETL